MLRGAAGLAVGLGALAVAGDKAFLPDRLTGLRSGADPNPLPDIQFDIGRYIGMPRKFGDGAGEVLAQLPPVHTMFTTAKLHRTPARADQARLAEALDAIEAAYPFAADGLLTFVSYGLPYFKRLPGRLVADTMPRLRADHARWALEEAVPGPTDVSPLNPGITKASFNTPVQIEQNDILITIRTDNAGYLRDVLAWLGGSNSLRGRRVRSPALFNGLATVTSSRSQFVQVGLPAKIAASVGVAYADRINPNSPMWMGFLDQQVNGSGPAAICTFGGNESARMTTAKHGDYFDNGSIQHLSHVIEDLDQFYLGSQTYLERVQYMFRSNPPPSHGFKDQYAEGGGPACLDNHFNGVLDAQHNAQGMRRMGHLCALQRSARSADGTAMHIRMDGPGLDGMDVFNGSAPKLQFTIFVPTAEFFRAMRVSQASLDLVEQYEIKPADNGLERFITATRRQNFLVPPRRHRAFPLVELA